MDSVYISFRSFYNFFTIYSLTQLNERFTRIDNKLEFVKYVAVPIVVRVPSGITSHVQQLSFILSIRRNKNNNLMRHVMFDAKNILTVYREILSLKVFLSFSWSSSNNS